MSRPCCPRRIDFSATATYFKPAGVPLRDIDEIHLAPDEIEAIRLADFEGLYQEQAAESMKVSRPTFSRIIESARHKIAEALIHGKALRLDSHTVEKQGDDTMANHDGTGPARRGRGQGRGRGCGREPARGKGRGVRRRGRHLMQAGLAAPATTSARGGTPS